LAEQRCRQIISDLWPCGGGERPGGLALNIALLTYVPGSSGRAGWEVEDDGEHLTAG
jgi:hypothetical protein